jgi:hypothetical protein
VCNDMQVCLPVLGTAALTIKSGYKHVCRISIVIRIIKTVTIIVKYIKFVAVVSVITVCSKIMVRSLVDVNS